MVLTLNEVIKTMQECAPKKMMVRDYFFLIDARRRMPPPPLLLFFSPSLNPQMRKYHQNSCLTPSPIHPAPGFLTGVPNIPIGDAGRT